MSTILLVSSLSRHSNSPVRSSLSDRRLLTGADTGNRHGVGMLSLGTIPFWSPIS